MSPPSPLRRALLRAAGLGLIFMGSGVSWRAYRNGVFAGTQGTPFAPWKAFPPLDPIGMLPIVGAGVLAASPHNTQPWAFDLTEDYVDVYADHGRALGPLDPFLRELHIGLGCAIENMVIAARAFGMQAQVVVAPGPLTPPPASQRHALAARILLAPAAAMEEPLLAAIPRRHTNRGPYDPARAPAPDQMSAWTGLGQDLNAEVVILDAAAERDRLGNVILAATRAMIADSEMMAASHRWLRTDWNAVQVHRDGLTVDGLGLPGPVAALAKLLPPPTAEDANRHWIESTERVHLATAPALGAILVRDPHDRPQAVAAGRLWQRLHLQATGAGIALQPLNQPAEMADRARALGQDSVMAGQLADIFGRRERRATMMFRAGFPRRPATPSPRRDVADTVLPRQRN